MSRVLARAALQRTLEAAYNYVPRHPADAMLPTFRTNHTHIGQAMAHGLAHVAILRHTARSVPTPNTVLMFTAVDAQWEVGHYLEQLNAHASDDLVNQTHITFTTARSYAYVETAWNGGDPQVNRQGNAQAILRMQWVDTDAEESGGYYQIYHLDPMP